MMIRAKKLLLWPEVIAMVERLLEGSKKNIKVNINFKIEKKNPPKNERTTLIFTKHMIMVKPTNLGDRLER